MLTTSDFTLDFPALGAPLPDVGAEPAAAAPTHEADAAPRRDTRKPRWHLAFYATSSPGASALRRQQGADRIYARNAAKVEDFIAGRCTASDVLGVTVSGIALCGSRLADARACFDELDRAVNAQTGERVRPDVSVYNALISAHERAGQHDVATKYLNHAVERQVFLPSLGRHGTRNELNLHRQFVETGAQLEKNGICADVARVIFRQQLDAGRINTGTLFIVGSHGENKVKDAIRESMDAVGWPACHPRHGGRPNEGCWVVDHDLLRHRMTEAGNDRRHVPPSTSRALPLRAFGEVMGSGTAFIG